MKIKLAEEVAVNISQSEGKDKEGNIVLTTGCAYISCMNLDGIFVVCDKCEVKKRGLNGRVIFLDDSRIADILIKEEDDVNR